MLWADAALGKTMPRSALGAVWNFLWKDNSVWSWLLNALLAFLIIKFLVYPGLGFALQTENPVVAVISNSMQHNKDFDLWWEDADASYAQFNITKQSFMTFPMKNGFSMGDIFILKGKNPNDIQAGDVIVFTSGQPEPIIHRVVKKWKVGDTYYFSTKGDNAATNMNQREDEKAIPQDRVLGTGLVKVPYVGYVKIAFSSLMAWLWS